MAPVSDLQRVSLLEAEELLAWPFRSQPEVEGVPVVRLRVRVLVLRRRLQEPRLDRWSSWRATILFYFNSVLCTHQCWFL